MKSFHLTGLVTIKDIEKAKKYPNAARDSQNRLLVAGAIGVSHDMEERAAALVEARSISWRWIVPTATARISSRRFPASRVCTPHIPPHRRQ